MDTEKQTEVNGIGRPAKKGERAEVEEDHRSADRRDQVVARQVRVDAPSENTAAPRTNDLRSRVETPTGSDVIVSSNR